MHVIHTGKGKNHKMIRETEENVEGVFIYIYIDI